MDDGCPCCGQNVPLTHAVEWYEEPAPGSGKWGMTVCSVCYEGIYGDIPPWEWVQCCLEREKKLREDLREKLAEIQRSIDEVKDSL